MSSRERMLLIVLIAVVVGGGLVIGVFAWFVPTYRDLNKKITEMTQKRDEVDFIVETFKHDQKRLNLARTRSLPINGGEAATQYMNYLREVFPRAEVSHAPPGDMKFTPSIQGIKKVGHQSITFQVRLAKTDLSQLVRSLEKFYKTPYEHRIKNMSIDRDNMNQSAKDTNPKLNVTLSIETLLIAKTITKGGLPPGVDPTYLILDGVASRQGHGVVPLGWGLLGLHFANHQSLNLPADRDYAKIAEKNIFVGAIPYTPPPPKKPKKDDPVVEEPKVPEKQPNVNVPAYVRLIHTDPDHQTAYLRNIVQRAVPPEMKLIAKERSGYDTFRIMDDETEYVFFKARVMRVDSREVFFQVKNKVYSIHIGKSLADAMEHALSPDEMDDYDLYSVYDAAWAKKEMEDEAGKDKKKTNTKKGGTKGRN